VIPENRTKKDTEFLCQLGTKKAKRTPKSGWSKKAQLPCTNTKGISSAQKIENFTHLFFAYEQLFCFCLQTAFSFFAYKHLIHISFAKS
jgi:hypothetical protein